MSHHRDARLTVERCLAFDVGSLNQALKCVDVPGNSGQISWGGVSVWSDPLGGMDAVLGCCVGRTKYEGLIVLVDPELTLPFPHAVRLPGNYIIRIVTSPTHLGSVRYWFLCPVEHDGKPCGRRVKKLYLPPGEEVLGCRACHDLTYRSVQKHDNRTNRLSRDPVALDAAIKSKNPRRAVLGIGALALTVKRMRRQQAVGNTPAT